MAPKVGLNPSWGKGLGASGTPNTASAWVTGVWTTCFSHPSLLTSPRPLGSQSPHSGNAFRSPLCLFLHRHLPFPSPEISLRFSGLSSWKSGRSSYSVTPLGLWDLLPPAGAGSPWWVTSRGGRGSPRTLQTLSSGSPLTGDLREGCRFKPHIL